MASVAQATAPTRSMETSRASAPSATSSMDQSALRSTNVATGGEGNHLGGVAMSNGGVSAERERVLQTFATLLGTTQIQQGANQSANRCLSAGLMPAMGGMGIVGMPTSSSAAVELAKWLVNDPTTLCSFPSLDLFSGDVPDLASLAAGSDRAPAVAAASMESAAKAAASAASIAEAGEGAGAGAAASGMPTPPASGAPAAADPKLQQQQPEAGQDQMKIPAMAASVFSMPTPPTGDAPRPQQQSDAANSQLQQQQQAGQNQMKIPAMAASVFSMPDAMAVTSGAASAAAAAAAPPPAGSAAATAMQAALKPQQGNQGAGAAAAPPSSSLSEVDNYPQLEERASKNLSEPIYWTRSSSPQAPMTMLRSLSTSFSSLIDCRMRSWTLVLLRHSLNSGDESSRSRLLSLLATSSSLSLTAIVTTFQTLSLPKGFPSAKDHEAGKIILPLIFEAVMDVVVQGQQITLRLKAPGTITGVFSDTTLLLKRVDVALDTKLLLSSMIEQARLVVFKAVATATTVPAGMSAHVDAAHGFPLAASTLAAKANPASAMSEAQQQQQQPVPPRRQAQFAVPQEDPTSLKRPAQVSPAPSPLQSFASMKLIGKTSGLERRGSTDALTLGKRKKNRSVTWNHQLENPSAQSGRSERDFKRRKVSLLGTNKLRSSKSFGKPDSSLFESNRNATFAEFGRVEQSRHVPNVQRNKMGTANQAFSTHCLRGGGGGAMQQAQYQQNASFSNLKAGGGGGLQVGSVSQLSRSMNTTTTSTDTSQQQRSRYSSLSRNMVFSSFSAAHGSSLASGLGDGSTSSLSSASTMGTGLRSRPSLLEEFLKPTERRSSGK